MFFLIRIKRTNVLCGISSVNTVRRNIVRYHRTSSNNHIISNSRITQHDTVSPNKNVIADADNTNFRMRTSFDCAGIMSKKPNIT